MARLSAADDGVQMMAYRWRRELKDVGDQPLMRGLATAFPSMRPWLLQYGCCCVSLMAAQGRLPRDAPHCSFELSAASGQSKREAAVARKYGPKKCIGSW